MTQLTLPTGASFHRGKSKQDYSTPEDFRFAVTKRFGHPAFDLAASFGNQFSMGERFFDEDRDSLKQEWHKLGGLLWLNCPFGDIVPWARKCSEEAKQGARILLLIPAAVGSNWFREWVFQQAHIMFLSPRLCFDGKNPFPKDCLLAYYGKGETGVECWRWK